LNVRAFLAKRSILVVTCLTARLCTLRHLPVPQADYHGEGEKFQNKDHPKGKKISKHCRDTTEYDIAAN